MAASKHETLEPSSQFEQHDQYTDYDILDEIYYMVSSLKSNNPKNTTGEDTEGKNTTGEDTEGKSIVDENKRVRIECERILAKIQEAKKRLVISKNVKYKIATDKGKIVLSFFNSFDKLSNPSFESVYLQVTYVYNIILSRVFNPLTTIVKMEYDPTDKTWTTNLTEWIRRNKLSGYQVRIQPFCDSKFFPQALCTLVV